MYYIAICEDDAPQRDYEEMLIKRWAKNRKYKIMIDSYATAEQFLFACEDKPPYDLFLLDIQMGEMNGMKLAQKLRENNQDAAIIF